MRRIHDRPLRSLCLGALIRDLFSGKLSTRSTLLSIRSGSHVYKRPRASRFELCIFFRSDILRRVFAGRRKSLSLSLSAWFNGSTILQRAVIPGAPRARHRAAMMGIPDRVGGCNNSTELCASPE